MKKIGLIDYYLDNWHASNLPKWLDDETHGEYKICYAWGSLNPDGSESGKECCKPSEVWCAEHNIELVSSAAEVVEKSDVLMVLAPNNPEQHEELCREALASGKRTYVDKTFAPDVATAKRIFDMARAGGTPMFSSSALRFSSELKDIKREGICVISSRGSGVYQIYSIHQIEMLVSLMGPDAKRVMAIGNEAAPALAIEFSGGRFATMGHFGWECPFNLAITYDSSENVLVRECTSFFPNFVHELVDFFETGSIKAPEKETIAVIGIREKGFEALKNPGVWISCELD
ncbi:MAG TPA: Gfo/Idh/MocA family oxidoreductase [Clostridiales bacterium]|nr:Gfo/Idh/MocA family oxidoreductase [Clostridiales bacterium]